MAWKRSAKCVSITSYYEYFLHFLIPLRTFHCALWMSLLSNFSTSNPDYNRDFKLCGSGSIHSLVILTRRSEDWGQDSPSHRCVYSPLWQIAPRALTALSRQSMGRAGVETELDRERKEGRTVLFPIGWTRLSRRWKVAGLPSFAICTKLVALPVGSDLTITRKRWRGYYMISRRNL